MPNKPRPASCFRPLLEGIRKANSLGKAPFVQFSLAAMLIVISGVAVFMGVINLLVRTFG